MKHLLLLFFAISSVRAQDEVVLRGTVRDATTGERLAAANIRVLGTSRGTVANADGAYALRIPPGKRIIIASSLAYAPDTLRLLISQDETHDFTLTPSDIILPEVVVSSEDPAIEIIRRAIANKKKWTERLRSFEMEAFTRQVLRRDTAIASITESFTQGYWQAGDTLREIVKQKRQTENVKSEFNFASVGRILNFNDDEIRFIGYTFVGPTAVDALDYYDYTLLQTRSNFGREINEIRMIPRSRTTPLFEGIINIAGDSYALMGVDVQPNEVFSIPFVKEKFLRYRQQFNLYESSYWMPADIRIDASATIGAMGISIPKITFSQTSVITNYSINAAIPDSIFRKPRLTIDPVATASLDSTLWQPSTILPLTLEEQSAYVTLDSTQTMEVQFRPRGFAVSIGSEGNMLLAFLEKVDFRFNRVEGFHAGGILAFDSLANRIDTRALLAYGFSDKRWKYELGATLFFDEKRFFGLGVDAYRRVDHRPDEGYFGDIFNSLTALFVKNDYRDYYAAEGWRAFARFAPVSKFGATLAFVGERHRSVSVNTAISIFAHGRSYRVNPMADEGRLRSFALDLRIGDEATPLDIVRRNALEVSAEISSPKIVSSDFDFTRVGIVGTLTVPTFARNILFPPALSLHIAAGTSSGTLPGQRLFDLESASSGYAPFGVFKGMSVKEFTGTSFIAANIEHNFRSLPFLALGIPFLYENNIELIVHGGAGKVWGQRLVNGNSALPLVLTPLPLAQPSAWYGEVGIGLNRIFDLLRADLTWRLSEPTRFRFTIGAAHLL